MSATARILTGLASGAILGLLLAWFDPALGVRVANLVQPFGKLWLNALQMTVVPLVLALVIVGVNTASDAASSGRVARRAIVVVLLVLSGAAAFTALVAMVPSNAIAAAAESAMLPLVVFALFFGFALTRIDPLQRERMVGFFQAIADAMIVVVRWVLWAAPVGVFALIMAVCARSGLSMLSALGVYILLECLLYLAVTVLMLPVAVLWGGEKLRRFAAALIPPQVVAASTQSSLASLPAMLQSSERQLGYPREVSSLVLPMAVSLFRITSPIQYVATACFIAGAFGVDLTAGQLATGAALAVLISMGSVGLPGQVSFMATNLPVTSAMGLPVGPLGLLLAVDTIPDVFATVGNVSADMTATSVVVRQSRDDA